MKNKINFLKENDVVHESSIDIKFKPGETVFFVENDSICKSTVIAVKISITILEEITQDVILYDLCHGPTFDGESLYSSIKDIPIADYSAQHEQEPDEAFRNRDRDDDLPF